ncbi:hypothetical protein CsatB_024945 [Cannabis sativa]
MGMGNKFGTQKKPPPANSNQLGSGDDKPRFKLKSGSLIPAKKRLVKTLILDYILKQGFSFFFGKKKPHFSMSNQVFPYPPELDGGNSQN